MNFIAWDTEGKGAGRDHRTVLIANSQGDEIYEETGIAWERLLDFLCHYEKATNVWFAFGYDVNMIFKSMPAQWRLPLFIAGKSSFELNGNKYHIRYIPRKVLRIDKNKQKFVHYDVWGFYQSSFLKMLEDWKIEIPAIIVQGKKLRQQEFESWSREQIREYNRQECVLLVNAMQKLFLKMEEASKAVGFRLVPRSWHGAGAIAPLLLNAVNCKKHKKFLPPKTLHEARKRAYFGGRIELFQRGHVPEFFVYDINSAYPSAARFLPSLEGKQFEYIERIDVRDLEPDTFGLVHCTWNVDSRVGPLPYRLKNGYVVFPESGRGWYHWVEVQSAIKKGFDIKVDSAWILPRPYNFFAKETIEKVAEKRLEFKEQKDLAHMPLKLGMNSLYGKLAQRPIQKTHAPEFLELLYAGFITAHCRAQILSAIDLENVILIATDGIFSRVPLNLNIKNELGAWEQKKCHNGYFLLAGIYCYDTEKNITIDRTRGFKTMQNENKIYTIKDVYEILKDGKSFTSKDRRFIGTKLANTSKKYFDCGFQEIERVIDWNNNIKRAMFFDDGDSLPFQNASDRESEIYKLQYEDELKQDLYWNDREITENYQGDNT